MKTRTKEDLERDLALWQKAKVRYEQILALAHTLHESLSGSGSGVVDPCPFCPYIESFMPDMPKTPYSTLCEEKCAWADKFGVCYSQHHDVYETESQFINRWGLIENRASGLIGVLRGTITRIERCILELEIKLREMEE